MDSEKKEQQAFELINRGLKDEAVELLSELIVYYAGINDFAKADSLRQTLIQTNEMALTQIINTGEFLEEKKSKAIDQNHKEFWRILYKNFSTQEATEFYFSLKTINIKPGKIIIKQGKLNDKLFFINQGKLKTICKSENSEVFLKEISAGEACGLSTFFYISTATTSVIASTNVNISYITQKAISKILKQISGFDMKLHELCKRLVKKDSAEIIKKLKVERRQHQRVPVKGRVATHLIGADGKPAEKSFYGIFDDLSKGGTSFTIKASTKEYARSLLGQKAIIKLIPKKDGMDTVTKKGWIVGLYDHPFKDYSISFRFHEPLPKKILYMFTKQ